MSLSKTIPDLEAVILINTQGNVIAANTDSAIGTNITDRVYFQNAMQGETNFFDILVSRQIGDLVVTLATPVKRNGKVVGVAAIATPRILRLLSRLHGLLNNRAS